MPIAQPWFGLSSAITASAVKQHAVFRTGFQENFLTLSVGLARFKVNQQTQIRTDFNSTHSFT
jgi:hypothetical protein